jgi:hypothetical protein
MLSISAKENGTEDIEGAALRLVAAAITGGNTTREIITRSYDLYSNDEEYQWDTHDLASLGNLESKEAAEILAF